MDISGLLVPGLIADECHHERHQEHHRNVHRQENVQLLRNIADLANVLSLVESKFGVGSGVHNHSVGLWRVLQDAASGDELF